MTCLDPELSGALFFFQPEKKHSASLPLLFSFSQHRDTAITPTQTFYCRARGLPELFRGFLNFLFLRAHTQVVVPDLLKFSLLDKRNTTAYATEASRKMTLLVDQRCLHLFALTQVSL